MNSHQKFKTATCVCLACACIFFCLIFLIPLVVEREAYTEVLNQATLRSDNYMDWGRFPGSYGVNIQKTFTLFNTLTPSIGEKINLTKTDSQLYSFDVSYENPVFVSNTNGQIQATKLEIHRNLTDEEPLKNQTITQPNFGVYNALYRESHFLDYQYITFELFRLISSFKTNFAANYYAYAIYHYYISNQTLTNLTIFLKNNLLTVQQSNLIWGDAIYGWSNTSGLKSWVDIILSNKFINHPNWKLFKQIFSLNDTQMQQLVGKLSKLEELFTAIQGLINDNFAVACGGVCTAQSLADAQWTSQISKTQLLQEIPPFDSYSDLNKTAACYPELAIIPNTTGLFMTTDFENLVAYDSPGEIDITDKSLFNFESIKFLLQNVNTTDIKTYFTLSTTDQAAALSNYMKYVQQNCLGGNINNANTSNLSIPYSYKDVIGLNNLMDEVISEPFQQIIDFLLVNLTNKAIIHLNINCSDIFADPNLQNQSWVCGISQLNINELSSNLNWIYAYYGKNTSQSWLSILSLTNLTEGQLEYFFSSSLYGKNLSLLETALVNQYNCSTSPCSAEELARLQWGSSAVTSDLPSNFFPGSDYTFTISDWNPTIFLGKIPEFYYYGITLDLNFDKLSSDQVRIIFSYFVGGLLEYHERQNFIVTVLKEDSNTLKNRFNLQLIQSQILLSYLRYVVVEFLFDGKFINKTPYEFLWGYDNRYIRNLKTKPTLMGGDKYAANISLQIKNNSNDLLNSDPSSFVRLDTGLQDETNSRKVRKFYGNLSIVQRKFYYNGPNLIYYFTSPWDTYVPLQGTDGYGFKPSIDVDENLMMFEDKFYRNLKLNYVGKTTCYSYDCQKYEISENEFEKSKNYNTNMFGIINLTTVAGGPLEVSHPYWINADQALYSNIDLINNQSISSYQKNAVVSYLIVEPKTGVTTTMFKNYQYNFHLKKNILMDYIGFENHYPVLLETSTMQYTDQRASYQFDDLLYQMKVAKNFRWVCVGLSAFFFVCFLLTGYKYYKGRGKNRGSSSMSEPLIKGDQVV